MLLGSCWFNNNKCLLSAVVLKGVM